MGKVNRTVEELLAFAKAGVYDHGTHGDKDTVRALKDYKSKILRNQRGL